MALETHNYYTLVYAHGGPSSTLCMRCSATFDTVPKKESGRCSVVAGEARDEGSAMNSTGISPNLMEATIVLLRGAANGSVRMREQLARQFKLGRAS